MEKGYQPRTGLEMLIMMNEAERTSRLNVSLESDSHRLTRKVTVRLGLWQYAALQVLGLRYQCTPTAMALSVLELSVEDALLFAGLSDEDIKPTYDAICKPLDESDRGLRETLEANDLELTPYPEEERLD